MRASRAVSLLLTVLVATGALAAAASGTTSATARLKLDGVPFRPELALTSAQHSVGLMNRRQAPRDGMLFVFGQDTTGSFWMKNTLVPLTIVFFDRNGTRVRRLSMTPCRQEECPLYRPRRTYRFALELPVTDRRPALRLGPLAEIRRLSRLAD